MPTTALKIVDTPAETGTPAAQGWDLAELTRGLPRRAILKRRNAASRSYGAGVESLLLPQADPFWIRARIENPVDDEARRRNHVRRLVQDVEGVRHRGLQSGRAAHRLLVGQAEYADRSTLEDAESVIAHYELITDRAEVIAPLRRSDISANSPLVGIWLGASIAASGMAVVGLATADRTLSVTISAILAPILLAGILIYLALNFGWRHGYNQATWHMAEVSAYNAKDVAGKDVATAREHAEGMRRLSSRMDQVTRETKALLARQQALHAEERRAQAELDQARLSSQATFNDLIKNRKMAFKLPRQPKGEGYLYVVEFSTGYVKVGYTEDPKTRLGNHRNEAAAFGVHVTNYWISVPHSNFQANERRLINQCEKVSPRTRKEYFHTVGYARAVEFASSLTCFSADTSHTSVEGLWS